MKNNQSRPARRGFTAAELVIVIAIIAVLASILIPVVGKVRQKAYSVDSENFLNSLVGAIERYHQDFRAYPGPVTNDMVSNDVSGAQIAPAFNPADRIAIAATAGYETTGPITAANFTMAENLVLGLLGGLMVDTSAGRPRLTYDPALVGSGPSSLNTVGPRKTYAAYLDANNLSWKTTGNGKTGRFFDDSVPTGINDSIIPEFVDRYPDPMPIAYLRAKVGALTSTPPANWSATDNPVVTYDSSNAGNRIGQYDLHQVIPYVQTYSGVTIGVSKKLPTYVDGNNNGNIAPRHGLQNVVVGASLTPGSPNYQYPYEGYGYFQNPSIANTPRNKDGFILIGAGPDRVYGTKDDITNFGAVAP